METTLVGTGVSPGIAIGPAYLIRVERLEPPRYPIEDPAAELARFDRAVETVRGSLERLRDQTLEELGQSHAAIFSSHLGLLDDVALRPEIERRLKEEKLNVEYLVDNLIAGYMKLLQQVDDPHFRERSSDLADVGRRILAALMETTQPEPGQLEQPSNIVAHDLSPADTMDLDLAHTLGMALETGGPTSPTAILARAFEIPAVAGVKMLGSHVSPGDQIIIDGTNGRVIVRPTKGTLRRMEAERAKVDARRKALQDAALEGPGTTLDGFEVPIMANIELPLEVELCKKANCQGVGLYRTEYLFMYRHSTPTEEEQYLAYKHVLESMAPRPVTIRTLDIGGDKLVPHLTREAELNPQLGWRSIRFCLDRPDIFKAQLRALFRAGVHGNLRIMFPMISGVDEMEDALTLVTEVREDLAARKVQFDKATPVGAMIEVPSAVMVADSLSKVCDFFSVGTNDLIQYALAVDRANPRTANLYQPAHPGVLRMLKRTVDAAQKADIPCFICGEMAGDPLYTEVLVGLGFESLSMSSIALPGVRAEVASIHRAKARRFATKLMNAGTVAQSIHLLQQRASRRGPTPVTAGN